MTDWKKIAEARGWQIPEPEMARVTAPLDSLEEAFRPLVKRLTAEVAPATVFRAAEEPE